MTLPQQNAKLLQVNESGGTADWDDPDNLGTEKFKGRVPAYYSEKRGVEFGEGGKRDIVVRRRLIIEAGRPGIEYEEDDVVVFEHKRRRGGVTTTFEVKAKVETVEERDAPELGVLGTVRLTLTPE